MKKRLPPLNWLRTFEASARLSSFTKAATELHMTQAAVSQQIKGLESQLGVSLFKRLPRGLELTEAGMAYLPAVHESVERLTAATDELFGQGKAKLLTIRVNLIFFTTWLSPRLHKFIEQHPDIRLKFASNIWVEDQTKDTDLEIRYGRGTWPGFQSDRLTWDELFPVCSPDIYEGSPQPVTAEEIAKHNLLHVVGYEEGWGYWLNSTGIEEVDASQGIQFDTLIMALKMAVHGQGMALGRTSIVKNYIASGRLIAPFTEKISTSEAFYITHSQSKYVHPYAEIFKKWIIKEAENERAAISN